MEEREKDDGLGFLRGLARHCLARGNPPPDNILEKLGLTEDDAYTEEQSHLVELHLSSGMRLDPKDIG